LLVLPACPLLDVEADVSDACVTYHGVQVDPMPQVTGTVDKTFTVSDLGGLETLAGAGFELTFESATVRPSAGIADLSFVLAATVTVAGGSDASLPPIDFDCANCGSAGAELDVVAPNGAGDAKPYIDSGSLGVELSMTGVPPSVAWTMDVDVCMSGRDSYQVNE
jgi:hypothetical protein